MGNYLKNFENKIGYKFKNTHLLKRALTHSSISKNNNERLEFFGDAILGFIIVEKIFSKYKFSEGILSQLKSNLVCKNTLSSIAINLNVDKYIFLKKKGKITSSILSNAIEALIASIYIDSKNIFICKKVVLRWFIKYFKLEKELNFKKDYKSILQEYLQFKKYNLPRYSVLKKEGLDHKCNFLIKCDVKDLNIYSIAKGLSKREAEKKSAKKILKKLKFKYVK